MKLKQLMEKVESGNNLEFISVSYFPAEKNIFKGILCDMDILWAFKIKFHIHLSYKEHTGCTIVFNHRKETNSKYRYKLPRGKKKKTFLGFLKCSVLFFSAIFVLFVSLSF